MFPEIRFVIAGVQLVWSSHGLAIATAVAAGVAVAARRARAPNLAITVASIVAVVALLGAHAAFLVLHGGCGAGWSGGLASMGGVVAGLAAVAVIARFVRCPARELLDFLAPAGLTALAIGRVGCFLGGCCYGRPTSLPWGVVFPEIGPPARHPLQLYSAGADLLLVALLPRPAGPSGTVARRAVLGFGVVRAGLEMFRDPATTDLLPGGWLTLPQAIALVLVAAAICLAPAEPLEYASLPEDTTA